MSAFLAPSSANQNQSKLHDQDDSLQIETTKAGKCNVVALTRAEVEAAKDGQPILVCEVVFNQKTGAPVGTTIVIKNLKVKNAEHFYKDESFPGNASKRPALAGAEEDKENQEIKNADHAAGNT